MPSAFRSWQLPLLYVALFLVTGLGRVGWQIGALPGWYWLLGAAAYPLALLAISLYQAATPERPVAVRAALIGAGWGVPLLILNEALLPLTGEPLSWTTPVAWMIGAALFGTIMTQLGGRR